MINEQCTANVLEPPASVASSATTTAIFDTITFDYATVRVICGTQATTDPAITTINFLENDANTTISNFSAIVPLTGGTATSTSVGYVLPAVTASGNGCVLEFHLDLRKRKRYIAINKTPGTTLVMGTVVTLSRGEQSLGTAALKNIKNYSATNANGCVTLVEV